MEGEGDVAGEDEKLGGGFGEEFLRLWAEGFGLDVEAGRLQGDGQFADAGDFVGAGISCECGGVDFD